MWTSLHRILHLHNKSNIINIDINVNHINKINNHIIKGNIFQPCVSNLIMRAKIDIFGEKKNLFGAFTLY